MQFAGWLLHTRKRISLVCASYATVAQNTIIKWKFWINNDCCHIPRRALSFDNRCTSCMSSKWKSSKAMRTMLWGRLSVKLLMQKQLLFCLDFRSFFPPDPAWKKTKYKPLKICFCWCFVKNSNNFYDVHQLRKYFKAKFHVTTYQKRNIAIKQEENSHICVWFWKTLDNKGIGVDAINWMKFAYIWMNTFSSII